MSDMEASAKDPRKGFRLGDFRIRPTAGEIIGLGGDVRHLEPKVMDVLVELARAYPEVLERDDVINTVWGGRPVSDDALARCVAEVRKVLGDSRSEPSYIQTVPKRGYRLVAAVELDSSSSSTTSKAAIDAGDEVESWSGPLEFENLKVIRLLGRGSMGAVHLAQETNLERLVAIKTLRGAFAGDERAERRFRREASAAARIDHPNVASVYRLGELPDGTLYIVMQYVRGRTLAAMMASSGEFAQDAAKSIVGQISQALASAHRERIIHRDVKPGNVLIEEDTDLAILSDFGIAGILETGTRIATRLTLHGEVLGDARYISPEQARGEPPTPASDIYSLGIIAYELLTGAYPYRERGDGLLAHLKEHPQPMSPIREGIDPAIERIVMQSLAKEPDERPTAEQFLAGMEGNASPGASEADEIADPATSRRIHPAVWLVALAVGVIVTTAILASS